MTGIHYTNFLRRGYSVALLLTALLLSGCGTEVNPSFTGFGKAANYHPFDSVAVHGAYLKEASYAFDKCTPCHGGDLNGIPTALGDKMRSCYQCHNANHHQVFFYTKYQHISYLKEHKWDMTVCNKCHNPTDPQAISFGGSCSQTGCHKAPKGPLNCNVCHGDFSAAPDDTLAWAPPSALNSDTATTSTGVGAHQSHLRIPSKIYRPVSCAECHDVPDPTHIPDHLGDNPGIAEVKFGPLASNRDKTPVWDREIQTCSNTYCHFNATPKWTQVDGTFSECGSCHTIPPDIAPHWPALTRAQCVWCHASVINDQGEIIAPEKHVNGVVDKN